RVIDCVDVWLGGIDLLQAGDGHGRKDGIHDQLRPEAGKIVLYASAVAEKRGGKRNDPEHDGVHPDQGIKNEIRAKAAEPAVLLCGFCFRYSFLHSPRGDGREPALSGVEGDGRAQFVKVFAVERLVTDLLCIYWHDYLDATCVSPRQVSF